MKICPDCGNLMTYNSYFRAYMCCECQSLAYVEMTEQGEKVTFESAKVLANKMKVLQEA